MREYRWNIVRKLWEVRHPGGRWEASPLLSEDGQDEGRRWLTRLIAAGNKDTCIVEHEPQPAEYG